MYLRTFSEYKSWGLYHKTFYERNLRIFVISYWQAFVQLIGNNVEQNTGNTYKCHTRLNFN